MSPKRLALLASPRPMPPQPISAIPGRSLGLGTAGGACADSSRSTNHSGNPVAAAMAVQWLRKDRREMFGHDGIERQTAAERKGGRPISLSAQASAGDAQTVRRRPRLSRV